MTKNEQLVYDAIRTAEYPVSMLDIYSYLNEAVRLDEVKHIFRNLFDKGYITSLKWEAE